MIPLHRLLSRIRWDPEFGRGEMRAEADSHFCFEVTDEDGITHSVPYHRVKEVWKDGELIWHREH